MGMINDVIAEHLSKRSSFYLLPKCQHSSASNSTNLYGMHGIKNIPDFGSKLPEYPINCDHTCHGIGGGEIETAELEEYWFSNTSPLQTEPIPIDISIDDGGGAIMISYSWGPIDNSSNSFPNQERAKKLAHALERNGYKIWIDTRYMRGNMFSKMAKVITNCKAVIACVSSEYHKEDTNAYKEFTYACCLKKKIYGVKLAKNTNMMEGAYGFNKGYRDKFYNLADCESDAEYDAVVDELVRDLNLDGLRIVQ